jgi:hypothetical protein
MRIVSGALSSLRKILSPPTAAETYRTVGGFWLCAGSWLSAAAVALIGAGVSVQAIVPAFAQFLSRR